MLTCSVRDPRTEPVLYTVSVYSRKSLWYAALATGYPVRSNQPSVPWGWVMIQNWSWVNVWPIAAYRQTQTSCLQLGLCFGSHQMLT